MVVAQSEHTRLEVLEGYIQDELVRQEAERLGFEASDEEIDLAVQKLKEAIAAAELAEPWIAEARATGFTFTMTEYFDGPEYRALEGLFIATAKYIDSLGPRSEVVDEQGHTHLDVKLAELRKKAKIVIYP